MHFFKGVSPWFLSKNGDFLIFSFVAKWMKKKCFFEGSERKEAFLEQKTPAQKTTKICISSNGLFDGFCQNLEMFLFFSFYAKWIKKKCFVKVLKEKKPF